MFLFAALAESFICCCALAALAAPACAAAFAAAGVAYLAAAGCPALLGALPPVDGLPTLPPVGAFSLLKLGAGFLGALLFFFGHLFTRCFFCAFAIVSHRAVALCPVHAHEPVAQHDAWEMAALHLRSCGVSIAADLAVLVLTVPPGLRGLASPPDV